MGGWMGEWVDGRIGRGREGGRIGVSATLRLTQGRGRL